MRSVTPEEIDALLPQTQCGLCGYGGCMPYAEAMVFEQAPINLCPPGGVKTLQALGNLLEQDPTPYLMEMEQKAKAPMVAIIRENECIGCTKCIQACPVDAILGSAKQMHTVIAPECTGCELCVPACPVDCIDMLVLPTMPEHAIDEAKRNTARNRFNQREQRLAKEKKAKQSHQLHSLAERKKYIKEALERAKTKNNPPARNQA